MADFVAEVGDQCGWALNRLFLKLSVADRSIGSGGFDAMAPTPTTAIHALTHSIQLNIRQ
jgi:hypothetical protein